MKVLFICRANIGRSQMAYAFFNKYSKDNPSRSAGTEVKDKEGRKIGQNEKARYVWEAMDEERIDVRDYKRTQLTPLLVSWADKVVIITEEEFCPDYLLNSSKAEYWNIPDPKGTDFEAHVKTRDEIKKRVKTLVERLR